MMMNRTKVESVDIDKSSLNVAIVDIGGVLHGQASWDIDGERIGKRYPLSELLTPEDQAALVVLAEKLRDAVLAQEGFVQASAPQTEGTKT